MQSSALSSSIVLVCRRRRKDAPITMRGKFLAQLRNALTLAIKDIQSGNIAPVDLAQAAIGPGMAVYTRYAKVLDASGEPISVRGALTLINQVLDEVLADQEGDFDADSRWALAWYDQYGFSQGEFGDAETLSKAKNTSIPGMERAGILVSQGGRVRLLKPQELPDSWSPLNESRLTIWKMVHHLIRTLEVKGEEGAAKIAHDLGGVADTARALCYRLYSLADRKNRSADALAYNSLVHTWTTIIERAQSSDSMQTDVFRSDLDV